MTEANTSNEELDQAYELGLTGLSKRMGNDFAFNQMQQDNIEMFNSNKGSHVFLKVPLLNGENHLALLKSMRSLMRAKYNDVLHMWEVDECELLINPQLKDLPKISYSEGLSMQEAQEDLAKKLNIINRTNIEKENRVYLDFIPPQYSEWAIENRVHYDSKLGKPYLEQKYAEKPENISFIAACRRKRHIEAQQIESTEITEGKKMLADAMNIDNRVEREEKLVEALNICAKEAAENVPGAIKDFSNVIRNFNRTGKTLNFKESYKLALMYHRAVSLMKKNYLVTEDTENLVEKHAEEQAFRTLNRQGGENLKKEFDSRLLRALKENNTDEDKLAQCSDIFSDYLHGHIMSYGTQLFDGQLFRKQNGFDEQDFMSHIDYVLRKANLSPEQRERIEKHLYGMGRLTSNKCHKFEKSVKDFFTYNDKRNLTEEEFQKKAHQVYEDGLEDEQILRDNFQEQGFTPVKPRILKDMMANVKPMPNTFEPLYIVMNREQRMNLNPVQRAKLMSDPYTGALCVADTKENRINFAKYFPTEEQFEKIKAEFEKRVEKTRKLLKQNGLIMPDNENLFDGQTHLIENSNGDAVSIYMSYNQKPEIVINNLTTGENKNINLQLSYKEIDEINRVYEEKRQTKITLKTQKEHEIALNVRKSLAKMEPVINSSRTHEGFEYKWFDEMGVDPRHLNAFLDKKHVYGDQVFKSKGTFSESTLFFPIYNSDGRIMSTVAIDDFGDHEFIAGGQKKGNFAVIGASFERLTEADEVIVCTSLESAAVLSEELRKKGNTSTVVVCSFGDDNLPFVAEEISRKMKGSLGICPDDGHAQAMNTGVNETLEACQSAIRAVEELKPFTEIYMPPLTTVQIAQGKKSWADLARDKESIERLKNGIEQVVNQIHAKAEEIVDTQEENLNLEKKEEQAQKAADKLKQMKV